MKIKKRALLAVVPMLLLAVGVYFGIQFVADLWWIARAQPLPAITVEANYPGASASVLADTVAAPIEMQVTGVEQMDSMRSICGSDGSYSLTVTFKRGTDLRIAQTLVQNRVALAMPILPNAVQTGGLSVKQKSPGILLIANVSSPDGSCDAVLLSNYAMIIIKDELTRVPGVGDIQLVGRTEQRARIEFDLKKLADHDLTLDEAVRAIHGQAVAVAGGLGRGAIRPGNRLRNEDEANNIILKALPGPRIIYLKDVARAEMRDIDDAPRLDGKPVASLFVYALPGARLQDVRDALVGKLEELRKRLPKGMALDVDFDFTSKLGRRPNSDYVWIDVELPAGGERERTLEVLERSGNALKGMAPVGSVLALSGPRFAKSSRQGCILVKLAPIDRNEAERAEIIQSMRSRLTTEIADARFRLRDLSGTGRLPPGGYPIDFALHGPDADKVEKFAAKLAERLSQNPSLIDVYRNPEFESSRQFYVEIAREKSAELGVPFDEINKTLVVWLSHEPLEWLNQLEVRCTPGIGAEGLKLVKIRSGAGKLVPLEAFAKLNEVQGPNAIAWLGGMPMEEFSASPAPGVSLADARSICTQLADATCVQLGLSREYRIEWP